MRNLILFLAVITGAFFLNACQGINQNKPETQVDVTSQKVLVLSIDGGGIKGIIPTSFLVKVEEAFKSDSLQIYQLFDVIGGTSTGGILSVGLTSPTSNGNKARTAEEILAVYQNDCGKIFYPNGQASGPGFYADEKDLIGHGEHGVEPFLKSLVGATQTLADAANNLAHKRVKQVFTTSYVVNSSGATIADPKMGVDFGPYLFNWQDALDSTSHNYYLWEAARATSAAPTYFPLANIGGGKNGRSSAAEKWAIDGGVMSNDPAVWAITESLRTGIAQNIDEIIVVSLGCGLDRFNGGLGVTNEAVNHQPYGQKYGFWGDLDWGTDKMKNLKGEKTPRSVITETALYANQFVPATQLETLANTTELKYYRVQLDLPSSLTDMSACGNVDSLIAFANRSFDTGEGKVMLDTIVNVLRRNQ
ncbi:MAG: hypothetical protein DWQ02_24450 [Bacteroidetes bacterium]|nr:MAG: hypothetical protein DWQ02_24450 [Bacteroidota bacterium]